MAERELTFRYGERKDVSLIFEFINKLAAYEGMPNAVKSSEQMIEEWLFDKRKAEVIFAVWNGKEIGFSLFYEIFAAYVGKGGLYIDDLYVEQEYRGKGIGRALLNEMAKIAVERGCGRLEWLCLKENPAMNFYKQIGAQAVDECVVFRVTGESLEQIAQK